MGFDNNTANAGGKFSSALHQETALQQQQRLSPMQVRYVRMLEMNQQEAEAAVERELDDNPALERLDPPCPADSGREPAAIHLYVRPAAESESPGAPIWVPDDNGSLYDHLSEQLRDSSAPAMIKKIAAYIIGNLDSNGYLARSPQAMVNDLAFGPGLEVTDAQMAEAMELIRSLDPPGVGAENLRDSILLQLGRLPESQCRDDALRIIRECFEAYSMKHFHRIVSQLKMPAPRVEAARRIISAVNPKPGSVFGTGRADRARPIVPDFIIDITPEGEIAVSLQSGIPELGIEAGFESAVKLMDSNARQRKDSDRDFVRTRYDDARNFIEIMLKRRTTLFAVMTAIVARQRDYLLSGEDYDLKPLALKDIAADTGYDVSTVSRATAEKYASTPYGILPLRFFFSEGYAGNGDSETVSARAVQAALKALVESEDKRHPLSDERLCNLLTEKGYDVSRRTVTKYRDRLGIQAARLRKEVL